MNTPQVSVILPTHNRANLLPRAIRSVLAQSWEDLELIVVDDASSDDTPEVVARIQDSRVRYIRHQTNRYAAGARNSGIRAARGEFIAFQDDDDIWRIDKLERQLAVLRGAPADVGMNVCGYVRQGSDHSSYVGGQAAFQRLDWRVIRVMKDSGLIATPGWLLRHETLRQAGGGFDERLRTWEDWELWLRIARVSRITHLNEPLVVRDRVRPPDAGLSGAEALFAHSLRTIIGTHEHHWREDPTALARHTLAAAYYETLHGCPAEGRSWTKRALRLRPFNPRAWLVYVLGLLGEGRGQRLRQGWRTLRHGLRGALWRRRHA